MFEKFITGLKKELKKPLPGPDAQNLLAPATRSELENEFIHEERPKPAAVLVLFYPKNEIPYLVLTERKSYRGIHGGQVSFPGGKQDPADKDLISTALREADEEIGLNSQKVKVLGNLSELFIPPSNFLVLPVVGFVNFIPHFIPSEKEVHEILEIPVSKLLDPSILLKKNMELRGRKVTVPCFMLNEKVVWGATAMILGELKLILENLRQE